MSQVFDVEHQLTRLAGASVGVVWFVGFAVVNSLAAADRIVLRDLDIIDDKTVVSFDEDGVHLNDRSLIPWDEIDKGTVAADKQKDFNALLGELGPHLYRIRQRLEVGDYRDIARSAEPVYARYSGRRSKTAYMVFQAQMWSRLANGQKEQALEPYFQCLELMRALGTTNSPLPGKRRLTFDPKTGMTPEISPVWFDEEAAKNAMPIILSAIRDMKNPLLPAHYIYYATLALSAGDPAKATQVLSRLESDSKSVKELRAIVLAQQEVMVGKPADAVKQLEASLKSLESANQPLALYWVGSAGVSSENASERTEGLMTLLRLPALYGERYSDLAAASLYRSMTMMGQMNDKDGMVTLRKELLANYGQSFHAAKVRKSLSPASDDSRSINDR